MILCEEELWEKRIPLQGNKVTPVKEFFHIKIFEPNYSFFLEYKTLLEGKRKIAKKTER